MGVASFLKDRADKFFDFDRGMKELMTFFRQGLKELRSTLFPESPHARETDPGMWGNKLPMEIYQDRHGEFARPSELAMAGQAAPTQAVQGDRAAPAQPAVGMSQMSPIEPGADVATPTVVKDGPADLMMARSDESLRALEKQFEPAAPSRDDREREQMTPEKE